MRVSMITEYQASFLHPSRYKSFTTTFTVQKPYHATKGTNVACSTLRRFFSVVKPQPKATTVYASDFRAWKVEEQRTDNLTVRKGFTAKDPHEQNPKSVAGNQRSVQSNQERKPFEGKSSYRLDYVPHLIPPRPSRVKPDYQTSIKSCLH